MNFKLTHLYLIAFFCAFSTVGFSGPPATSCFSIGAGDWDDDANWNCDGVAGGNSPTKGTAVVVSHAIALNVDLGGITGNWTIDLGASVIGAQPVNFSSGTHNINGILTCNQLDIDNGATVLFASTSNVTVNGSFTNKNNSAAVTIDTENFRVTGNLTNGNGGHIGGAGSIFVDGTITNGTPVGTLFGCSGTECCTNDGNDNCLLQLPIELLSFGVYNDGIETVFEWSTGSEINNDYFIIEESIDGNEFTGIMEILGAGNSFVRIDYQYSELRTAADHDIYYRIVDVDFDGAQTASNVFTLQAVSKPNEFSVRKGYNGALEVLGSNKEEAELFLYDIIGGLKDQIKLSAGTSNVQLSEEYTAGIYLVVIRDINGVVLHASKLRL